MKTLSKTEYENETNPYKLTVKLFEIDLLYVYFAKAAIYIAKSIQHLIPEEHKKVCFQALETAEKYLRGEATQEECKKATDAACNDIWDLCVTNSAACAVSRAINAVYYAYYSDVASYRVVVHATNSPAHATINAAYAAYRTTDANADKADAICDIVKQSIPWNLVCAFQIAKCFGNQKNEQFIQEIIKDESLINYATIILEDENLRKEFEFFMKDYVRNESFIKN